MHNIPQATVISERKFNFYEDILKINPVQEVKLGNIELLYWFCSIIYKIILLRTLVFACLESFDDNYYCENDLKAFVYISTFICFINICIYFIFSCMHENGTQTLKIYSIIRVYLLFPFNVAFFVLVYYTNNCEEEFYKSSRTLSFLLVIPSVLYFIVYTVTGCMTYCDPVNNKFKTIYDFV